MVCKEINRLLSNIKKKNYNNFLDVDNIDEKILRDERCVEIPYSLSRYKGQKKILEIGLCLADTDLVETQILLKKYCQIKLSACDIVDFSRVKNRFQNLDYDLEKEYKFTLNDIRNTIYDDSSFDFVYLISTLEHVGFDEFVNDKNNYGVFNRSEKTPNILPAYSECNQDIIALKELERIISKNGSLIITLPYGKRGICALKDSLGLYSLYKEYSYDAWKKLLNSTNFKIKDESFFSFDNNSGWKKTNENLDNQKTDYSIFDPVKHIICCELTI